MTSERKHKVRIQFVNNVLSGIALNGTALNGVEYKAIVSHPSRENSQGNESTHGNPREIPVGAQCSND